MLLPHITVGIKIMISKEIASVEPVNEKNTPNKAVHNIADNKPKNSKMDSLDIMLFALFGSVNIF